MRPQMPSAPPPVPPLLLLLSPSFPLLLKALLWRLKGLNPSPEENAAVLRDEPALKPPLLLLDPDPSSPLSPADAAV